MTYTVKEIFKTIQGEGQNAGRVAVFCRFAGCNLWSGRERDRATSVCQFCDTDFFGGQKYKYPNALAREIERTWGASTQDRMVVLTGGEPALQFDDPLREALHKLGFYIAIETNGSVPLKARADWVCISPKAGAGLVQFEADELKVVYPQKADPLELCDIINARVKSVQPMDGPDAEANTKAAIEFCLSNPTWRLSVQTHKMVGIR